MLGLVDLTVLLVALALVWRRRYAWAFRLLVVETLWAIAAVLILVNRDGRIRFIRGFGAEPYFAEYLGLMAVRVLALGCLWWAERRTRVAPPRA